MVKHKMGPQNHDISAIGPGYLEKLKNLKLVVFDFDGVFTDNKVYVNENGSETVACWRSDGLGLSKLKELNIPVWVISTETNLVVTTRCQKLGIECIQACSNKLEAIISLTQFHGCSLENTVFTGNDINDLSCLQAVGVPIVVADAHPDVVTSSCYVTKNPGGRGAVREVCDLIVLTLMYKAHDLI